MILFPWQKRKKEAPGLIPRDWPMGYRTASLHEQGKRQRQEDSFALVNHQDVKLQQNQGLLALVADGMGGMKDGKLASGTAAACLCNSFTRQAPLEEPSQWLEETIYEVSGQIHQLLEGQGGSTLIACLIREEKLWFASVGDSFLYLLRDGELSRLNRMQTVFQRECMDQLRSGSTDPTQPRQHPEAVALTGFLGMTDLDDIDVLLHPLPLLDGDTLLLCSDGVGGMLEEEDILYCLRQGKAQEVCDALGQRVASKDNPHQDNFTAVVIQCMK